MPGTVPNVLLIIADTVRADHLDLYGYQRPTTPRLARRIGQNANWTVFDRCYSTAGWTLPACASIITGQNPDRHGLIDHTRRFTTQKLAGALRATHRTVGIANNGNLVSDDISVETLDSLGLARRPKKWNHFGWNDGFDRYEWFPHDQHWKAINKACRLIDRWRDADRPWFLMFHTNLAHDYNLDRPYYRQTDALLGHDLDPRLHEFPDGPDVWNELVDEVPDLSAQIVAKYDSGIQRLDRTLDDVIGRVDLDNTIVVVVSDHGEGFEPEHGRVHHCGRLHEDLLWVPLLFHTPPSVSGTSAVARRVRHVRSVTDIVPTILRMTGASSAETLDGSDLFGPERHRSIFAMDSAYLYRHSDGRIRRLSSDQGPVAVQTVINYPLKTTTSLWENQLDSTGQVNLVYDPLELSIPAGPTTSSPEYRGEKITAVTVVVDSDEFAHNLAASPDIVSGRLELEVIDNQDNKAGDSIAALYTHAKAARSGGPIVFVHPDVYLPSGWLARVETKLVELDSIDPQWVVAGIAGRLAGSIDRNETGIGHWADPHGYRAFGQLPHRVDVVDELIIIVRDRSIGFDPEQPGFHCYGTELCATAQHANRTVWVIDAFAWHKMRKANRSLVTHSEQSHKITNRSETGFDHEFTLSAGWVRDKWQGRQKLQGMTEHWRDFYGEG